MSSTEVLLITGANTGLGFETVKSLLQSSTAYTILLSGRSIAKADAAARSLNVQFPESSSNVRTIQVDIEDDESINRAFEHISQEYGRLDILINNAGKVSFLTRKFETNARQERSLIFS
jgi:NAD(P)-dependent dehydrogenase (short-subunit alcohol dehydrogenase family)